MESMLVIAKQMSSIVSSEADDEPDGPAADEDEGPAEALEAEASESGS